jgi:deoxyribodipyrimidine photolyase-like uncharacterized protein
VRATTPEPAARRWLFADQLGPHFLDTPGQPVLLIESRAAFGRRPVHRQRAHLVLSALRHRAAELGGQATLVRARTYREVRWDLYEWQRSGQVRLTGRDGPRQFPVTRAEAVAALKAFVRDRLPGFGPHQDAMLAADPVLAHSHLSPALNLGLLDPLECVRAAGSWCSGTMPCSAAGTRPRSPDGSTPTSSTVTTG